MIKILLNSEDIQKAQVFSNDVIETNYYYKQRGQSNKSVIREQIFIGKLGEFGVRKWLINNNHNCTEVDIEIYQQKTFNSDFIVDDHILYHVKSQSYSSAQHFGISWTFQYSGLSNSGHRDKEIFDNYTDDARAIFCLVNPPEVYICANIKISDLHKLNLFMEPKKKTLIGIKKVVYLVDIPEEFLVFI